MKVGFHDQASWATIQPAALAGWVINKIPLRTVDYRFTNHYHPYTEALITKLNREGLIALLDVNYHAGLHQDLAPDLYQPGDRAKQDFPREEIDVSDDGPYSIYNWELLFHAPLAIAVHLSKNQRFKDAQRWFHFLFDPTSTDSSVPAPRRFWKFLRFRQETDPEFITELLTALAKAEPSPLKTRIETAITAWRDHPFQPHVVARTRYLAYQLNVIMKYLDNLLAWGDNLFRQDTIETLNEATQIYVLAANILGRRPQRIPPRRKVAPRSYAQLKAAGIDAFGNALVECENEFPFNAAPSSGDTSTGTEAVWGIGRSLYFCIPQNDQLLAYWDKVADRLFKIRHCMNIEGIVRQLALFDPPIDPGALVRAAASGMDIASIVNNVNQPVSTVRGPLLLQKALELCTDVKVLGSALLAAIEKQDAEHLSALRQDHELAVLERARDVRFLQWKDAEAATESLLRSRATAFERYRHYKKILGVADTDLDALKSVDLARTALDEKGFDGVLAEWVSRYAQPLAREAYRKETSVGGIMEFAGETVVGVFGGKLGETLPLNKNENAELNIFLPTSDLFSTIGTVLSIASGALGLVPQFNGHGTPLGVGVATGFGGVQLSKFAKEGSDGANLVAQAFRGSADRASKMAGYYRRAEDYVLQANLASSELEQYGRQIIGALLREQIARKEFANHKHQIEAAEQLRQAMADKFTNEELYAWMQGEISDTYFDCYKFAFDLAKRAEQTLKHEVMRPELDALDLIKFGYWDSARRGLLAGEALYLDLKRLEMAYQENNRREYELTRHVSLARLDPIALLKLKATGAAEITVPEWLFDLDCPGQYMRRLKTVAVTIPCITGPFSGVHCRLSLLRSSIRTSSVAGPQYARNPAGDDDRFRDYTGAIQSIVTSTAQNDSGLFELNLRDDRYLPFEGAGAISTWRLELPSDVPPFDFETISDVILHLRYTAREAGHLRSDASSYVTQQVLQPPHTLLQLFCLNYDFGAAWHQFTTATTDATRKLEFQVTPDQFPYWTKPLGMDDAITATFAVIDWTKHKLTIAPATAAPKSGDAHAGWTFSEATGSPVFPFLKKNLGAKVYLAIAYSAKP
jgi:hypothetical protein